MKYIVLFYGLLIVSCAGHESQVGMDPSGQLDSIDGTFELMKLDSNDVTDLSSSSSGNSQSNSFSYVGNGCYKYNNGNTGSNININISTSSKTSDTLEYKCLKNINGVAYKVVLTQNGNRRDLCTSLDGCRRVGISNLTGKLSKECKEPDVIGAPVAVFPL